MNKNVETPLVSLHTKSTITKIAVPLHYESPQAYSFPDDRILIISKNFNYLLCNTEGQVHGEGKLPLELTASHYKMNTIYCHWWCHYEGNKIIYHDHHARDIKIMDLSKPVMIDHINHDEINPKNWGSSSNITVEPENIHNFMWLDYQP